MHLRQVNKDKDELNKSAEIDITTYDEESSRELPSFLIPHTSPFLTDLKIFGTILQLLIVLIYLGLIIINILNINFYCQVFREYNFFSYKCALEKCHYILMSVSLVIINLITSALLYYDYYQGKKGGYRLSDYFLYFIAWAGGWIPILTCLKYTDYKHFKKNSKSMFYYIVATSIFSITTPGLYVLFTY